MFFEKREEKVKITPRPGEEATALAIDQCVCTDDQLKGDGMCFIPPPKPALDNFGRTKWKGYTHAFEQLHYMQNNRPEYKQIETEFMAGKKGSIKHEAFIVLNFKTTEVEQQKLEKQYNIRVKPILHREASSPLPDVRKYLF